MATAVIGAIVIGSMIFVGVKELKKIKNGQSSCGCGCEGCSSARSCHGIQIKK